MTIRSSSSTLWIGCSGWAYPTWKPEFYPPKTPAKKMLEYYATQLNSVEVNYTFRQLPSAATVDGWLAQTGADFRFSFKAPQRITHIKRLKDCERRALCLLLRSAAGHPRRAAWAWLSFSCRRTSKRTRPGLRASSKEAAPESSRHSTRGL